MTPERLETFNAAIDWVEAKFLRCSRLDLLDLMLEWTNVLEFEIVNGLRHYKLEGRSLHETPNYLMRRFLLDRYIETWEALNEPR